MFFPQNRECGIDGVGHDLPSVTIACSFHSRTSATLFSRVPVSIFFFGLIIPMRSEKNLDEVGLFLLDLEFCSLLDFATDDMIG